MIAFLRQSFRRLVQRIRRNYPRLEYMAGLELTVKGTPHLHVLTRGSYISQRWLSDAWKQVSQSYIVHITKIDNVPGAVDEVCKYLVKTAARVQRLAPHVPMITMSRGWLPPDYQAKTDHPDPAPGWRFFNLNPHELSRLCLDLGGHLVQAPDHSRRWTVEFSRAPPWDAIYDIVLLHSYSVGSLALYLWSHFAKDDPDWLCYEDLELQIYGKTVSVIDRAHPDGRNPHPWEK